MMEMGFMFGAMATALVLWLLERKKRVAAERDADLMSRILRDRGLDPFRPPFQPTTKNMLALVDQHRPAGVSLRTCLAEMSAQLERGYPQ